MIACRCVTMQKNERALLEPWLRHHAALFGFAALTVIDNGSDDPFVLDTLRRYEALGVTVLREYGTAADFLRKGEIMVEIIRGWDRDGGYTFAFPLDCDEFLLALTADLSPGRDAVLEALTPLAAEKATLLNTRVLLNVPDRPGYFVPQIIQRGAFVAGSVVGIDRGLHHPVSRFADRHVQLPLACLHLHNRPDFADIQRAARAKLRAVIGDADPATTTPTEESHHLFGYFRNSEEAYRAQYRDRTNVYCPGIPAHFHNLGLDPRPLLGQGGIALNFAPPAGYLVHTAQDGETRHSFNHFDPVYYAQANPDVARDAFFGLWPLAHYTRHGAAEGRRPNGLDTPPIRIEPLPGGG